MPGINGNHLNVLSVLGMTETLTPIPIVNVVCTMTNRIQHERDAFYPGKKYFNAPEQVITYLKKKGKTHRFF